jgi:hypothetical protein
MFHLPKVPFDEIKEFIIELGFVSILIIWFYHYVKSKLHRPKCLFCGHGVSSDEQAGFLIVPAHIRCYLILTIMRHR